MGCARYKLTNTVVGEGGYSKVIKCIDSIGIHYACKVLPKNINTLGHVKREVSVMRTMQYSPRVVKLIDAGHDEKNYYIVQELCQGGDAFDYVRNHDQIKDIVSIEQKTKHVVQGTLQGLVHLHQNGIVHSDIKANNILLSHTEVKLGDFGTACVTDGKPTVVKELIATPWFMAPENMRSIIHTSSDVWSVGVLAYHLLTGFMPFNDHEAPYNPSTARIWKSILLDTPTFSSSRWAHITNEAKDFIGLCLNKEYVARPSALEALAHPWLRNDVSGGDSDYIVFTEHM